MAHRLTQTLEIAPGERVTLESDSHGLRCDRRAGELRLIWKRPLLGPRETIIPLDSVAGLRLTWSEEEARPTLRMILEVLRNSRQSPGKLTPDELDAQLPKAKDLTLIVEQSLGQRRRTIRHPIRLETLDRIEKLIDLGMQLAAAAGLPYAGVFQVPGLAPEFQVRRETATGFGRLPLSAVKEGGEALSQAVATRLASKRMPPFEPALLRANLKMEEWEPGRRIRLRRGLSAKVVLPSLGSLLLLAGPALAAFRILGERPLGGFTVGIVTLMGFAFGGACLSYALKLLPQSLVFDWQTGTLERRSMFRRWSLHFGEIRAFELRAHDLSRSSGDGSTYELRYCELAAILASSERRSLLETEYASDISYGLRQAAPLASELAGALGIEVRFTGKIFERRARSKP